MSLKRQRGLPQAAAQLQRIESTSKSQGQGKLNSAAQEAEKILLYRNGQVCSKSPAGMLAFMGFSTGSGPNVQSGFSPADSWAQNWQSQMTPHS